MYAARRRRKILYPSIKHTRRSKYHRTAQACQVYFELPIIQFNYLFKLNLLKIDEQSNKDRNKYIHSDMADTYTIALVDEDTAWDAFVRKAVGSTVFSTSTWLHCSAEATGGEIHRLGCFRNGNLIAGVAGLARKRSGLQRLETPELTPHTGLLLAPIQSKGPAKAEAEQHRACDLLIEYLETQYDHVLLVHTPAIGDMRPFTWRDWDARLRYTYQLDLADTKILWDKIERRTRTVIRKAEKLGYTLQSTDDVALFRRLYETLYNQQSGGAPIAAATTERFVAAVLKTGLGQAYKVESPEGQVASVVVFVNDSDTTYAWAAGADPALNNTGATSLLYWQYFATTPLKRFDFVGANIPAVAFFKRGFGGDLKAYYVTEGYKSKWVKRALSARRALRG